MNEAGGAEVEDPTPEQSVLVCTTPRSGSWLLAEALEGTGGCGHPREYFRLDHRPAYLDTWGLSPDATFPEFLAGVSRAGTTPNGRFCAKVHWGQLIPLLRELAIDPRGACALVTLRKHFPNPVFIHLQRANKVRQAISLYRAIHSGVWWRFEGDGPQRGRLPADPDHAHIQRLFHSLVDDDHSWSRFFAANDIIPIRVTYAELDEDYAATVSRVLLAIAPPGTEASAIQAPRIVKQADELTRTWEAAYLRWVHEHNPDQRPDSPHCSP
jgi:LPS sulfotransferase NodH